MLDPQDNPYLLDKKHNQDWFRQKILPKYEALIGQVVFPRIAIVAGQPGAGKSTAVKIVQKSFGLDTEVLVVDMDKLREEHPDFPAIQKNHSIKMPDYTGDDAGEWKLALTNAARRKRSPLIYEHTLRRTPSVEETINDFAATGYEVDLHCVAVSSRLSVRNVVSRYTLQECRQQNTGRWVELDVHHDAYEAFPANAQYFQDSGKLRLIAVYNMDKQLSSSLMTDTGWDKSNRVEDIINAERNKPWSPEDRQAYLKSWEQLQRKMANTAHFPQEITDQAKPYILEAALMVKAIALGQGDDQRRGIIAETTPHCVFIEFDNGDIRELTQLPKKPLNLQVGDDWTPRPYPARPRPQAIKVFNGGNLAPRT